MTETTLIADDPWKGIPVLARRRSPSMTVMGTYGQRASGSFVLGSTAEGILRHSSRPVISIGPNAKILHEELNIRHILYATDCSAEAACAAPIVSTLAEIFGAQMDVVNVVDNCQIEYEEQISRLQQHLFTTLNFIIPLKAEQFSELKTFISPRDAERKF